MVDDLKSFQRICPEVDPSLDSQTVFGIQVLAWHDQTAEFETADIADIVLEFFACDIPPNYIKAMAQCEPRPIWMNLEGLTAEEWVEGCHRLPSPHPQYPLTKYFFFPGFNQKTGGLLLERDLLAQREAFLAVPETRHQFLQTLGVNPTEMQGLLLSLFCYPHAPVTEMLEVWRKADEPITCLVPEGVAVSAIEAFLGEPAKAGVSVTRDSLTVRVLSFVPQHDYDRLLWACDFNFVRGEDSFVRAQWAAHGFIWHIYPQDENLHHKKLRAFLSTYAQQMPALQAFALAWNEATPTAWSTQQDWQSGWQQLRAEMPKITQLTVDWAQEKAANGDFVSNLLQFAAQLK